MSNHLKSQDGSTVDVQFDWAPDWDVAIEGNVATLAFDGRERPLAYFGEGTSEMWDVSFINDTSRDGGDMWAELQTAIALKEPLQWTDTFGNDITVVVSNSHWKPIVSGDKSLRRISFRMTRVEDAAGS
jgi:hypothetical protein